MSLDILLLNMQKPTLRGLIPDNGLALLASCLAKSGFTPAIMDLCSIDKADLNYKSIYEIVKGVSSYIEYNNIRYLGIKLWMNGFEDTVKAAAQIKRYFGKKLTVIGGGPQVDFFWEYFDRQGLFSQDGGPFDVFVVNEGEKTLPLLLSTPNSDWDKVPNLVIKKNETLLTTPVRRIGNLDSLPIPSYNLKVYPAMEGNSKLKLINIRTNWGCPYAKCNFCFHPVKSGKEFREHSVDRVIHEIEHNVLYNKTTAFRLGASSMSPTINDIAKRILESGLKISYSMFGNISLAKKYDFSLLKKSGCESIFYGAESGAQSELNWLNKGITVEQIEQATKETKNAGINAMLSFIYLGRKESKEQAVEFISKIRPSAVSIFPLYIMPRTPLANSLPPDIELSETYFLDYMNLKINLTQPKQEWLNLRYRLNGKTADELLSDTMQIEAELEQINIPTRITDENFVIAKYTGMTPSQIRDFEPEIESGNHTETVLEFVRHFNYASEKYAR